MPAEPVETDDDKQGQKQMQQLPHFCKGQKLALEKLEPSQHFTKPPPRYTEASLIRALEKHGIGRPSTYAPIISTILERGYVLRDGRRLVPTELGILVTEKLERFFSDIMDVKFTSQVEEKLDLIEEERADWLQVLREFYQAFMNELKRAQEEMVSEKSLPAEGEQECPHCGRSLLIRRSGPDRFLGCSGYPECRYTEPLDQPPVPEHLRCQKCDSPLTIKRSKSGYFLSCSRYPDCRFSSPVAVLRDASGKLKLVEEYCQKCGRMMVLRKSRKRRGKFLACSGYPECRNTKPLPR
jgi:DNA topoisomerase-1